jgi:malonyl CoA-acyl carrier protein transacylase
MNTAFLFPGQGSQYIGMGKDFYDNFNEAREVFQEVDETLKYNLSQLIFTGDIAELTLTQNAQSAIMAASMAILRTLIKQSGKEIQSLTNFAAGHSLGEYSALCAVGSFSLQQTAKLLRTRGQAMQNAVTPGTSGMVALLGADIQSAEKLVEALSQFGTITIANDNGAGQIVLSGESKAIEQALGKSSDFGIKRAIKLPVSAAFHSPLMQSAELQMAEALNDAIISPPLVAILSNITAQPETDASKLSGNLIAQVCGRVRWRETMENLISLNCTNFIEVGPGKVLSNIARKMAPTANSLGIEKISDLDAFLTTNKI